MGDRAVICLYPWRKFCYQPSVCAQTSHSTNCACARKPVTRFIHWRHVTFTTVQWPWHCSCKTVQMMCYFFQFLTLYLYIFLATTSWQIKFVELVIWFSQQEYTFIRMCGICKSSDSWHDYLIFLNVSTTTHPHILNTSVSDKTCTVDDRQGDEP